MKETITNRRLNAREPTDGLATDASVTVEWQWSDGRVRTDSRGFHRFGDEWRMPIHEATVDGVLNYYRSRPFPNAQENASSSLVPR